MQRRRQLAGLDEIEERQDVLPPPAVGADDVELEGPDEPDILGGMVAGGGAAGEEASVPAQYPQRFRPGVAAGEVDDDVDPAGLLVIDVGASEQAAALRHPVRGGVVDPDIGAEFPEAGELRVA